MSLTMLTAYDERPEGAGDAVYRAGGTDLQERLRTTGATPHVLDLTGVPGFAALERTDTGTILGAGVTVATVARELADAYPALALTAAGLATPQVRATATVGGNLLQRTRCWYFRHPHTSCLKSGGDSCPARDGRHLYGVAFDTAPCVHPHPSSLAMALLTYAATLDTTRSGGLAVGDVLGDGSDPSRDHLLADDEVLTRITLPPPVAGERAAYFRAISRFEAEWPLVEAVVRVVRDEAGTVTSCGLAIGGVAPVPLRLRAVEALITGSTLDDDTVSAAAAAATDGADPLPETGYKVALVEATVREVLERVRS
ncbi:xanthine dehydrogenase family protein subunit M [Terrabacter aerolatus]|uniref:FAD-binding molybdopterin dehydrogenase n=1 Tax=Terrabacter aerolatus TaxID=422442 RepID=A0A512D322_9MICO|nr:FAD binding domain-containing protein [Terrabacter aerolatus]GEO30670.1 FAD-binding molybdopterin dehydrogenase [Terrabacter aerolatus]